MQGSRLPWNDGGAAVDGEEGSASVRGRGTGFVGGSRRGGNFSTYSAQRPAAARFQPVPAGYARTGSLSPVANSTDGKPAGQRRNAHVTAGGRLPCSESPAGVAQLAEQPSCKRQVSGSIPLTGSPPLARDLGLRVRRFPGPPDGGVGGVHSESTPYSANTAPGSLGDSRTPYRDSVIIENIRDTRLRNGAWTLNRYRAEIGEPPVPGGDDAVLVDRQNLVLWTQMKELSNAKIAALGTPAVAAGEQPPNGEPMTGAQPGTDPQGADPADPSDDDEPPTPGESLRRRQETAFRRRLEEMLRATGGQVTEADEGSPADQAYAVLAERFPGTAIVWAREAEWTGPMYVGVTRSTCRTRDSWAAPHDGSAEDVPGEAPTASSPRGRSRSPRSSSGRRTGTRTSCRRASSDARGGRRGHTRSGRSSAGSTARRDRGWRPTRRRPAVSRRRR